MPRPRFLTTLAVIAAFTSSSTLFAQSILYVDDSAAGANNGSNWCDAFVYLQDGLAARGSGGAVTEIRVAQGTYKPDQGANQVAGDRTVSFELVNGAALRGGYAGCGAPDPNARDIPVYESILSGDLDSDDAPNDSNCCWQHAAPGCDETVCQATVCALRPQCCSNTWDDLCTFFAINLCTGVCGGMSDNSFHVVTATGVDDTALLDGFRISAGNAAGSGSLQSDGGGMLLLDASPAVQNCMIISNFSVGDGGAVAIKNGSAPRFNGCYFTRNTAANHGGAIAIADGSTLLFADCEFVGNSARETTFTDGGGAIYNDGSALTLRNCVLSDNITGGRGGAVFNHNASFITIGTTFLRNATITTEAHLDGGGAVYNWTSDATVSQCVFEQNYSNQEGSIYNDGVLLVSDSLFVRNTGYSGPGIWVFRGSVKLERSTFRDNMTPSTGGAVGAGSDANLVMTDCLFENNVVQEDAGAIYVVGSGNTTTIVRSRFLGNHAGSSGGGAIVCLGATVSIADCLFHDNSAAGNGGAIYIEGGTLNIANSTLTRNSTEGDGGGIWCTLGGSNVSLTNSIFWGNGDMSGQGEFAQIAGGIPSILYSCIQGWSGAFGGQGNIGLEPLFSDDDGVDDFPGNIDDDFSLRGGSPCIDAGDNSAVPADLFDLDDDGNTTEAIPFDLDDNGRFRDDPTRQDTGVGKPPIIDMGAYEFQPPCPAGPSITLDFEHLRQENDSPRTDRY